MDPELDPDPDPLVRGANPDPHPKLNPMTTFILPVMV
jgi:hypothetical protein